MDGLPAIALFVRQPWAWAIIHGRKDIENRSVSAIANGAMRPGRIAIGASLGMTRNEYEAGRDFINGVSGLWHTPVCPPPGEWVQVGEGTEDALTGALIKPDIRAIAAVSISNIGGMVLPQQIAGVMILKQNDANPKTEEQFDGAMDRLLDRGIEPVIVPCDPQFKDFNDQLRGRAMVTA